MSSVSQTSDSGLIAQYQRAIKELEDDLRSESRRSKEKRDKEIEDLNEKHQEVLQKKEKSLEKTIDNFRQNSSEAFENEKARHVAEADSLKEQIYNSRGEISKSIPKEAHDREIAEIRAQAQKRHELDFQNIDGREDELLQRVRDARERSDDQIRTVARQKESEIQELGHQIKALNTYERELEHQKAEEMADYRRTLDNTYKTETRHLDETYQNNLSRLKDDLNSKEDYFGRLNAETLKEKEKHLANVIRQQNTDHQGQLKETTDSYNLKFHQMEQQRKADEKRSRDLLETKTDQLNQEHLVTLENQAKNYGETIARLRKTDEDQINNLQKTLQLQSTTEDTSQISPAAESALRKSIVREYEKVLKTELDKNKINLEDSQARLMEDYNRTVNELSNEKTAIQQTSAGERASDRLEYFSSLQEVEDLSRTKLREQEIGHERERQSLYRNFGNMLERQRQDYEHVLSTTQSDYELRLATLQKEAEIQSKSTHRDFSLKQNELIHEYERKLSDQKADYEFKLETMKSQAQKDNHETDRQKRLELEIQAKGYEQRLAQQEAQSKERERMVVQNYQDELDKTRRHYELLSQKKS